ncbi:MAG: enoyl-CoA hydratase/isomerase family protein [Pseudomonadales bacterium]|nr:enoyl-CoA hydratase/isomerase family protein [Pseudomonadales bacterium]
MKGTVHYQLKGEVALLSIDNPPVNPLSSGVRLGLFEQVNRGLQDGAVKAIVLTGMHRAFIAGADISELGSANTDSISLQETLQNMEASSKPIIAALNGTAFGGGLEVALCCDYRIAAATAPVGLPEVKLGLLPGAGGTQRLPRLIGAEAALTAIISGEPILAAEAWKLGIVDEVVSADTDFVAAAIKYAENIIASGAQTRKVRDLEDKIAADRGNAEIFARAASQLDKTHRNQLAPRQILKCIDAAVNSSSFDAGLEIEQQLFNECMTDPQREALIHIFFAERAANKIPGLDKSTNKINITKGAVIGSGTMGGGIAMCFANAGLPVHIYDNNEENLSRGMQVIADNYKRTVSRGRLTQAQMNARIALISPVKDLDEIADADVVVEAVYENLDLKKDIFRQLDKIMKPGALLATNTSGLDVDAIAAVTSRPDFVCGLHFFSPANVMRLLEVVKAKHTSPLTLASAMSLGKQLNKVAVVAGNCPGFIGNRMLGGYSRQANLMILEGATPTQIDEVLYDFGMAMGPFAMADMVGLDLGWRARKMVGGSNEVTTRIADALCELGRYGQKNFKGYYQYIEGDRSPRPDPDADAVIKRVALETGFPQKQFTPDEILKRCIYPLVNIGARLLEEGHAYRASDIDTVYVNGYGFPAHIGGPMWYADQQGLDKVLVDIENFYSASGDDLWRPSALLKQLVAENSTFADYVG